MMGLPWMKGKTQGARAAPRWKSHHSLALDYLRG